MSADSQPSTNSTPQGLSNADTLNSESNGSPWSSAVGRATTGKSGRVIERLMVENDRTQREKNLLSVKLEEESKRGETARAALDSLETSNQNLASMHDLDTLAMGRKDRKIEELKAELEHERSRRERAESDMRATQMERDQTVNRLTRESMEDREQAKRSNSQYDVLTRSWKGLEDRYERQTRRLKSDIQILRDEIANDKRKVSQLEVILEQLRHESEKTRKAKESLAQDFEAYKSAQDENLREMREKAEKNGSAHELALREMDVVLGRMKYVVNVKQDVKESA